jgi:hypothetical protein
MSISSARVASGLRKGKKRCQVLVRGLTRLRLNTVYSIKEFRENIKGILSRFE